MPTLYHDHWWTCFPAIPQDRADSSYARVMRVCADHTLNSPSGTSNRSVYKHGGEDHLVLAFFENFAIDTEGTWIAWLGDRLKMRAGKVTAFNWSYSFEERVRGEARPRIADIIVCWKDDHGTAVIVIEAKRKGGIPVAGVNAKDDPRIGYYLDFSLVQRIPRKQQVLLIDEADVRRCDPELQSDPRLVTWQQLAAVQREIFEQACPDGLRSAVRHRLTFHHGELGLGPHIASEIAPVPDEIGAGVPKRLADWIQCSDAYIAVRRGQSPPVPFEWLTAELSREALLGSKRQLTRDREKPLWQLAS